MGLLDKNLADLLEKISEVKDVCERYECKNDGGSNSNEYIKKSDVIEMIHDFHNKYLMSFISCGSIIDADIFYDMILYVDKSLDSIEIPSAFLDDIEKSSETLSSFKELFGDDYKLDDIEELKKIIDAKNHGAMFLFPKDGMIYCIEEANGERWISNKPIREINIRYGWGLALLQCSLFDKGKYFSREDAEKALKRMEDEK